MKQQAIDIIDEIIGELDFNFGLCFDKLNEAKSRIQDIPNPPTN